MEEAVVSSPLTEILNYLALGLSVLLLIVVAYLWSSNSRQDADLQRIQTDLQRLRKKLTTLEEKVNEIREPQVIAEVPQAEPFGLNLSEPQTGNITPLEPQSPWINFLEDFNKLAGDPDARGYIKKCERFIQDNKLKILTYGGTMTFRPAIDAKDSLYWAFKCSGEEYAVFPNPMNPCDENLYEFGGMKEIYEANYEDGAYRKYIVKQPAMFIQDPIKGWTLKKSGVVNLERK